MQRLRWQLAGESDCAAGTGFYRPNLRIDTSVVEQAEREQALFEAIDRNPPGPAIIYVTLQKTAEQVAQRLADAGLPARAYHAGLNDDIRNEVQEWFMAATDAIVVATIAFGMGVDKANIRPLILRTLLTYLELAGYLEGGTPFYSDYKFKPLHSSAEILSRFQGERRGFLAALFRRAVKGRIWFSIDPAEAATALQKTRDRIVQALEWLGEEQLLEVKVAGIRHRFQILQQPEIIEALADELHQRMLKREEAEIHRLQQVLDLVTLNGCQSNALARHFGEQREAPCGHCSWCRRGKSELPPRQAQTISDAFWQEVIVVRQEQAGMLAQPRVLSRFLCGITSPHLSRSKLTHHPLFGSLENISFRKVLSRAQQSMQQ